MASSPQSGRSMGSPRLSTSRAASSVGSSAAVAPSPAPQHQPRLPRGEIATGCGVIDVPIYLIATKSDFTAERDHLRTVIFPALNDKLSLYGIRLSLVDPIGDSADLTDESFSIRDRLRLVEQCSPFVIYLSGERYGYVPSDYSAINTDLPRYEWIQEAGAGMSHIELEVRHALECATARENLQLHQRTVDVDGKSIFVYYRSGNFPSKAPSDVRSDYQPENGESSKKVQTLRDRIKIVPSKVCISESPYFVQFNPAEGKITDFADFTMRVTADLTREILSSFSRDQLVPQYDHTRLGVSSLSTLEGRMQLAYAEDLSRPLTGSNRMTEVSFLSTHLTTQHHAEPEDDSKEKPADGDAGAAEELEVDMSKSRNVIGVVAGPGGGKTTLMSRLLSIVAPQPRDAKSVFLVNIAGTTPYSTSWSYVLWSWARLIGHEALEYSTPGAHLSVDELARIVRNGLLELESQKRQVYIILDGIEEMTDVECLPSVLDFLPTGRHNLIKAVIGAELDGPVYKALDDRGAQLLALQRVDGGSCNTVTEFHLNSLPGSSSTLADLTPALNERPSDSMLYVRLLSTKLGQECVSGNKTPPDTVEDLLSAMLDKIDDSGPEASLLKLVVCSPHGITSHTCRGLLGVGESVLPLSRWLKMVQDLDAFITVVRSPCTLGYPDWVKISHPLVATAVRKALLIACPQKCSRSAHTGMCAHLNPSIGASWVRNDGSVHSDITEYYQSLLDPSSESDYIVCDNMNMILALRDMGYHALLSGTNAEIVEGLFEDLLLVQALASVGWVQEYISLLNQAASGYYGDKVRSALPNANVFAQYVQRNQVFFSEHPEIVLSQSMNEPTNGPIEKAATNGFVKVNSRPPEPTEGPVLLSPRICVMPSSRLNFHLEPASMPTLPMLNSFSFPLIPRDVSFLVTPDATSVFTIDDAGNVFERDALTGTITELLFTLPLPSEDASVKLLSSKARIVVIAADVAFVYDRRKRSVSAAPIRLEGIPRTCVLTEDGKLAAITDPVPKEKKPSKPESGNPDAKTDKGTGKDNQEGAKTESAENPDEGAEAEEEEDDIEDSGPRIVVYNITGSAWVSRSPIDTVCDICAISADTTKMLTGTSKFISYATTKGATELADLDLPDNTDLISLSITSDNTKAYAVLSDRVMVIAISGSSLVCLREIMTPEFAPVDVIASPTFLAVFDREGRLYMYDVQASYQRVGTVLEHSLTGWRQVVPAATACLSSGKPDSIYALMYSEAGASVWALSDVLKQGTAALGAVDAVSSVTFQPLKDSVTVCNTSWALQEFHGKRGIASNTDEAVDLSPLPEDGKDEEEKDESNEKSEKEEDAKNGEKEKGKPDEQAEPEQARDNRPKLSGEKADEWLFNPHRGPHVQPIRGLAFHPNGEYLVTAGHDDNIRVWSGRTGDCLALLSEPPAHLNLKYNLNRPATAPSFAPNGRVVVTGMSNPPSIEVFDLEHTIHLVGIKLDMLSKKNTVIAVKVCSDSDTVLACDDQGTLVAMSLSNGKQLWKLESDLEPASFDVFLDMKTIAVAGIDNDSGGPMVITYDLATRNKVKEFPCSALTDIVHVSVTAPGDTIIVVGTDTVLAFDVVSGDVLGIYALPDTATCAAQRYSGSETHLVVGCATGHVLLFQPSKALEGKQVILPFRPFQWAYNPARALKEMTVSGLCPHCTHVIDVADIVVTEIRPPKPDPPIIIDAPLTPQAQRLQAGTGLNASWAPGSANIPRRGRGMSYAPHARGSPLEQSMRETRAISVDAPEQPIEPVEEQEPEPLVVIKKCPDCQNKLDVADLPVEHPRYIVDTERALMHAAAHKNLAKILQVRDDAVTEHGIKFDKNTFAITYTPSPPGDKGEEPLIKQDSSMPPVQYESAALQFTARSVSALTTIKATLESVLSSKDISQVSEALDSAKTSGVDDRNEATAILVQEHLARLKTLEDARDRIREALTYTQRVLPPAIREMERALDHADRVELSAKDKTRKQGQAHLDKLRLALENEETFKAWSEKKKERDAERRRELKQITKERDDMLQAALDKRKAEQEAIAEKVKEQRRKRAQQKKQNATGQNSTDLAARRQWLMEQTAERDAKTKDAVEEWMAKKKAQKVEEKRAARNRQQELRAKRAKVVAEWIKQREEEGKPVPVADDGKAPRDEQSIEAALAAAEKRDRRRSKPVKRDDGEEESDQEAENTRRMVTRIRRVMQHPMFADTSQFSSVEEWSRAKRQQHAQQAKEMKQLTKQMTRSKKKAKSTSAIHRQRQLAREKKWDGDTNSIVVDMSCPPQEASRLVSAYKDLGISKPITTPHSATGLRSSQKATTLLPPQPRIVPRTRGPQRVRPPQAKHDPADFTYFDIVRPMSAPFPKKSAQKGASPLWTGATPTPMLPVFYPRPKTARNRDSKSGARRPYSSTTPRGGEKGSADPPSGTNRRQRPATARARSQQSEPKNAGKTESHNAAQPERAQPPTRRRPQTASPRTRSHPGQPANRRPASSTLSSQPTTATTSQVDTLSSSSTTQLSNTSSENEEGEPSSTAQARPSSATDKKDDNGSTRTQDTHVIPSAKPLDDNEGSSKKEDQERPAARDLQRELDELTDPSSLSSDDTFSSDEEAAKLYDEA